MSVNVQGLRVREDLESLAADELAALRAGFAAMYAADDNRSYSALARLASPGASSAHGGPLFLPWNRAYLNLFEQALRDFAPAVTLPWWDWSSEPSRREGIPAAFAADLLPDGTANPLAAAALADEPPEFEGPPEARKEPARSRVEAPPAQQGVTLLGPRTSRQPRPPAELPTAAAVDELVAIDDFAEFSGRLETMHNQVHSWVGGTLGLVSDASWDPLYWVLQAMVDRTWWRWQNAHPSAALDPTLISMTLTPFSIVVADVLDTVRLGYVYREGPRPAPAEVEVDPRVVADLPPVRRQRPRPHGRPAAPVRSRRPDRELRPRRAGRARPDRPVQPDLLIA